MEQQMEIARNDNGSATPRQHYETHGYYIRRRLVPHDWIDELLRCYQQNIVPAKEPFYRQNSSRYECNDLNEHGYVTQSFLDIHEYRHFPDFSRRALEIYTSAAVRGALKEVTGFDSCNLMQTMLFDANTETWPHQDWWYLDSVPNGHLLAAWFALEDIDERAGRFFVVPGSQTVDLHSDTPNLPHTEWIARMGAYIAQHPDQVHAPALQKGDVLFWNSRVIHGSLPTQDSRFSRRSLTAHYLPSEFLFGNLFVEKPWVHYKTYNGMKYYRNQPDYSLFNRLKYGIKTSVYDSPRVIRGLRKVQKLLAR
jgi:phytanoyl-CoA hydroxylase